MQTTACFPLSKRTFSLPQNGHGSSFPLMASSLILLSVSKMAGGAFAQWLRLVCLRAPDVAWVLRGRLAKRHRPLPFSQVRPLHHPACPRPGSRPARDASRSRFGCCDSQSNAPRHARLCYSSARPGVSLHCRRMAKLSKAKPSHFVAAPCFSIAMRRIGLLRLSVAYAAVLCFSLALSRGATPSRDIAFQSRRPANLGGALPSPGHAPQSNAFAARISPSPLHAAALLRHNGAVRHLSIAARCATRLCRRHS